MEDEKIYTVRLGIHSDPNSPGAIPADSIGVLAIPTKSAKEIQVMASFMFEELYPAVFWDSIILFGDKNMHLEYVYNSARLEPNNGLGSLTLSKYDLIRNCNVTFLSYGNLVDELPHPGITFLYDFITVQIKVKFDE